MRKMNSDVLLAFATDTLKNAIEIKDMEDVIVKIYLFTDHERKINLYPRNIQQLLQ